MTDQTMTAFTLIAGVFAAIAVARVLVRLTLFVRAFLIELVKSDAEAAMPTGSDELALRTRRERQITPDRQQPQRQLAA